MTTTPTEGPALSAPSPSPATQHAAALRALALFLVQSEMILATWDTYSDQHSGPDGHPHDAESYGWRAVQRDSQIWRAFQPVLRSAPALLATARFQLQQVAARDIDPRWPCQFAELGRALDGLQALRAEGARTREAHRSAPPPHETYIDGLAELREEAWSCLDTWATHGRAVLDLHVIALRTPSPAPLAVVEPPLPHATTLGPGLWTR